MKKRHYSEEALVASFFLFFFFLSLWRFEIIKTCQDIRDFLTLWTQAEYVHPKIPRHKQSISEANFREKIKISASQNYKQSLILNA